MRYRIMFAVGLGGLLLTTGGCLGLPSSDDPDPVAASKAAPSPTGTPASEELKAALLRTQAAPFRFAVDSGPIDGQTTKATGAVDPVGKRYEATTTTTGGTGAGTYQHIVIGADGYQRADTDKQWVHLDLSRTKPTSILVPFTMADPTGLETFTGQVGSVQRTGPHEFSGKFNAAGTERRYLPIGVPSVTAFFLNTSPFKATTDDQGRVTMIRIELTLSDKPKVVMTTTFSDHGTQPATKAPAKKTVVEADDMYYR